MNTLSNGGGDELRLQPITTARYTVEIVMNEDEPNLADERARHLLAAEFQRALDDNYFGHAIRYDSLDFEVKSREVLRVERHPDGPDDEVLVERFEHDGQLVEIFHYDRGDDGWGYSYMIAQDDTNVDGGWVAIEEARAAARRAAERRTQGEEQMEVERRIWRELGR